MENGYPSSPTVALLYDELDFQRAVQAYVWAMPTVALDGVAVGEREGLAVFDARRSANVEPTSSTRVLPRRPLRVSHC